MQGLLSFHLTSVSEEKQKSDTEEDGEAVSQEAGERRPKAEVTEWGCTVCSKHIH